MRSALPFNSRVDLPRYMGDWRVIASIPLFIEKGAYAAVESYHLDDLGRIQTTYTFHKDSTTGPLKTYHSVATVYNTTTNAEWRVQFVWPFKSVYLIHYLDEAYGTVIVGSSRHAHVWIMSRTAHLSEEQYQALVHRTADLGYEVSKLQKIPQ